MKTKIIIIIVFTFALCGSTFAQYLPQNYEPFRNSNNAGLSKFGKTLPDTFDYNYEVSVIHPSEECDVELEGGLKLVKVNIVEVEDSLFTVTKTGINRDFAVSGLNKISFIKHGFWKGFAWGILGTVGASVLVYALVSRGSYNDAGLAALYIFGGGAVLGLPIGLVLGAAFELAANDETYGFGNLSKETKLKRLRYILSQHKE